MVKACILLYPNPANHFGCSATTANNKRKEMTLAKYSDLSLADALADAAIKMKQFRDGLDPLVAKKRAEQAEIKTVDDLFADSHIGNVKRIKQHEIPERIYHKDIAPHKGTFNVNSVNARDIREALKVIAATGRQRVNFRLLMLVAWKKAKTGH